MYSELHDFLELAMLDRARVEVVVTDGESFTGVSRGLDEADFDDLGWHFDDVMGADYSIISFKDILSIKRVDEPGKIVYAPKVA
jgi:hypothetical protein